MVIVTAAHRYLGHPVVVVLYIRGGGIVRPLALRSERIGRRISAVEWRAVACARCVGFSIRTPSAAAQTSPSTHPNPPPT